MSPHCRHCPSGGRLIISHIISLPSTRNDILLCSHAPSPHQTPPPSSPTSSLHLPWPPRTPERGPLSLLNPLVAGKAVTHPLAHSVLPRRTSRPQPPHLHLPYSANPKPLSATLTTRPVLLELQFPLPYKAGPASTTWDHNLPARAAAVEEG